MSSANPLWGAPQIGGELGEIGIDVAKSTVEKHMVRSHKPPSPTWKAFLKNHIKDIVAIDFFVMPTVRNQILYVLLVVIGVGLSGSGIKAREIVTHPDLFLMPLGTMVGSVLGGLTVGLLLGMRAGTAMALASGFGWYSWTRRFIVCLLLGFLTVLM
jgi:hypothetical protein